MLKYLNHSRSMARYKEQLYCKVSRDSDILHDTEEFYGLRNGFSLITLLLPSLWVTLGWLSLFTHYLLDIQATYVTSTGDLKYLRKGDSRKMFDKIPDYHYIGEGVWVKGRRK